MKILLLSVLAAGLLALDDYPPQWVLDGILYVETKSIYREDGSIKYVIQTRGAAGEYGPFQMTRAAWKQIKRKNEPFWKLETDTKYAEELAARYLMWLDKHYGHGDWRATIQMYNAGPNHRSTQYLYNVLKAAGQ